MKMRRTCCIVLVAVAFSACARSALPIGPSQTPAQTSPQSASSGVEPPSTALFAGTYSLIKHVVVIDQENRSFDNLFHDFPGANTVDHGYGHNGTVYPLVPVSLAAPWDLNHSHDQFLEDYDRGRDDGFDREIVAFRKGCNDPRNEPACWDVVVAHQQAPTAYGFVPVRDIEPYWAMARSFALSDQTFQSNNGPSYPSHQYMIAGQSAAVAENPGREPWGCDAPPGDTTIVLQYGVARPPVFSPATGVEVPGPPPCFAYPTIATLLDNRAISWAYYAAALQGGYAYLWSAFDAIEQVRSTSLWFTNVKSPETQILSDIADGALPQVAWVTPSYPNSDHGGSRSLTGPAWVASIVNAIGESRYWNDTAIIIFWDDWGGWYDHVAPPQYPNPATGAYEGLGFRVPLIVVSPYAKRGYISHVQHEIASSLHFIEDVFELPSLGEADARADALSDMFDFSQPPAKFTPIPAALPAAYFLRQQPSSTPPDD
jgi:phospholipase C